MSSEYSLLNEAWLPARRASGGIETVRPCDVTLGVMDDPIVAFDWPRPDFDAAAREFLIGLISTACWKEVADEEAWETWWEEPPPPDALRDRFAPFASAFNLDGDGPRFMQDLDSLDDGKVSDVSALLIDSPGDNTLDRNSDLFVKRGRLSRLGRPAAAMALHTLQTFAPSGGAGHRTSLRGGGPLATLLVPDDPSAKERCSLWHLVWANVVWKRDWPNPLDQLGRVFPWLAPTRLSKTGKKTTPEDVHPAQAFWGMPRRIRLEFSNGYDKMECSLTGQFDDVVVERYRTTPHGNNYEGWSRAHPLTPYYRPKAGSVEWLPVHAQPGRLGYRDWLGLVVSDAGDNPTRVPAECIGLARGRLKDVGRRLACRLSASGFDVDNMKARGFVESQMPVHLFTISIATYADESVRLLVRSARHVQDALSSQVARALSPGNPPAGDKGDRHLATVRFWDRTEPAFYSQLDNLADAFGAVASDPEFAEGPVTEILRRMAKEWLAVLRRESLAIFDDLVPLDTLIFEALEPRIAARRSLVSMFGGFSKAGGELFGILLLPLPAREERPRETAS